MNVVIPPLIIYVFGAILVVAGVLRAWKLGRRDRTREVADDDPARARTRRRHLTWGVIWVLTGLFLIVSTAGTLKTRSGATSRVLHVDRVEGPAGFGSTVGPSRESPPSATRGEPPAPSTTAPPPEKP